jgi:CBS domain-containing protein
LQIIWLQTLSNLIWVDAGSTIEKTAILFTEKKIGALLVKENGEYVGIITKTDIIERVIAKGLDPKTTLTGSVMSKPLLTMDQSRCY